MACSRLLARQTRLLYRAIRCAKCGELQELIDTDKDGHDAEIGDSSLDRGSGVRNEWECNSCNSSNGRLIASFGYQFWPDDEVARRPQDYFDAFILTHICFDTGNAVEVATLDCASRCFRTGDYFPSSHRPNAPSRTIQALDVVQAILREETTSRSFLRWLNEWQLTVHLILPKTCIDILAGIVFDRPGSILGPLVPIQGREDKERADPLS